ncbi:MAG: bifunctional glutamate N-acetyltransferase/amino-acid acetyltransferase ArgJ [Cystobacterineae bacterium]|nr:bifunctional glutamate N-acetyltransferase/amino-acid acetyltransferase ArgJ [Cystobacterineae bacterium]
MTMQVPKGFLFSGVHAGIKPMRKDLALVWSEAPCAAAACVTVNKAKAAPCLDVERHCPKEGLRAILINSGNANALTGQEGLDDVAHTQQALSKLMGTTADAVWTASTGIIGVRLPKQKIIDALPALKQGLEAEAELAAEAMMTTDTQRKMLSRTIVLGGKEVVLSAICKGSGMIAPELATMICVVTTDAVISAPCLQAALRRAMETSFNCLTVDNDMSTNDVVFAMANGLAQNPKLEEGSADHLSFCEELTSLCRGLAKLIAADGEGATRMLEVRIGGAPSQDIARAAAMAVANSMLVKAALFGADPNWGRVLAAIGAKAGTQDWPIQIGEATVIIQGICVYDGACIDNTTEQLRVRMREPEIFIDVDLHAGIGTATAWGCDLSYDYVKINADYTSLIVSEPDGSVKKDDRLSLYSPQFKVKLVRQALAYISRFAKECCVLRVSRHTLANENLEESLCEDINLLRSVGMVPIVVHGEGPESAETLTRFGPAAATQGEGQRVREMVLHGETNAALVAKLNRRGGHAIGVSGKDGALIKAQLLPNGQGVVKSVNVELLEMFMSRGYVPVVASLGLGEDGQSVALDVDDVVLAIAAALRAKKLVLMIGAQGVCDDGVLLNQLNNISLKTRLEEARIDEEQRDKARLALKAVEAGVTQVHLVDARMAHSIIAELFTDQGVGTVITHVEN